MTNPAIFFILAKSEDSGETWTDDFSRIYETGAEAQKEAQANNRYYANHSYSRFNSFRYRVRKVVDTDSDNFIAREATKGHNFVDWSKLPDYAFNPPHFQAHWHPVDKTKIRFFPELSNAIEERWLVCKAPRFFNHYAELSEEDSGDYLVEVGYYSSSAEFEILTDADAIVAAYEDGPTSCMNDPEEYSLCCDGDEGHPAQVYASPDLALAVIKRDGEVTARCVVSPIRKIFWRAYGHSSLLKAELKKLGYRETHAPSAWEGLRILRVESEEEKVVCPYLDMVSHIRPARDKKYMRLTTYKTKNRRTVEYWSAQHCDGYAYRQ